MCKSEKGKDSGLGNPSAWEVVPTEISALAATGASVGGGQEGWSLSRNHKGIPPVALDCGAPGQEAPHPGRQPFGILGKMTLAAILEACREPQPRGLQADGMAESEGQRGGRGLGSAARRSRQDPRPSGVLGWGGRVALAPRGSLGSGGQAEAAGHRLLPCLGPAPGFRAGVPICSRTELAVLTSSGRAATEDCGQDGRTLLPCR